MTHACTCTSAKRQPDAHVRRRRRRGSTVACGRSCSARPAAKRSGSKRNGSSNHSFMWWVWIGETTTIAARRDAVAAELELARSRRAGSPAAADSGAASPSSPAERLEPVQVVEGRATRSPSARLSSRTRSCHSGCLRQLVGHRRERARRRVVGGHHQEDHVVDDLLVGEARRLPRSAARHRRLNMSGLSVARACFGEQARGRTRSCHSRPSRPR